MKAIYLLFVLICFGSYNAFAQLQWVKNANDILISSKNKDEMSVNKPGENNFSGYTDELLKLKQQRSLFPKDTLHLPRRNYLRNDDPAYNKRYSLWIPLVEVPVINASNWAIDHYIQKADYSNISLETWKSNFQNGWVWDTDDFPTNFSWHPWGGSWYFNAARSNGYNFYQSAPFALYGSLMWEYFGENTQPSYNDLINTTISGTFLGEVLYRLSSSVLDDRKRGGQRVLREVVAGVIDPTRGVNRILQGKSWRIVDKDIYQKEPLYLTVAAGARQTNDAIHLDTGSTAAILNLKFTYGDAYEQRPRKAFDYFHLRMEFNSGDVKSVVGNVVGTAYLFGGSTDSSSKMKMLIGGFQHYDYWNTDSFEIGAIGFGGGFVSRLGLGSKGFFQNEFHIAGVPLGASNARKVVVGDVNANYSDYTFAGGAEAKYETALNFGWGEIGAEDYLYWLHTYVGKESDNLINIFRPRITIKIFKIAGIGYEFLLYNRNEYNADGKRVINVMTGEQRLYLLLDFENF